MVYIEIRDSDNSIVGRLDVGTSDDFPLTLTRKLSDYTELNKRSGVFSNDFEIPLTEQNASVLGKIYDANLKDTKEYFKRKDAIIYSDNVLIARGKIKVLEIIDKKETKYIKVNFFGDNLDWVTQLSELALNEVNFVDSSFTFNTANIKSSWSNTADNNDYVFSLLYRGENHSNQASWIAQDFRPDLFVKRILTTSFNQIGYNLESTFFDTSGFESLILPYFGTDQDNWKNSATTVNSKRIQIGRTTDGTTPIVKGTEIGRFTGSGNTFNCTFLPTDAVVILNVDSGGNFTDPDNTYNTTTGIFDNFTFFGDWTFDYDIRLENPQIVGGNVNNSDITEVYIRAENNTAFVEERIASFSTFNPPTRIQGSLTFNVDANTNVYCYIKFLPIKQNDFYSSGDCVTDIQGIQYTIDATSYATATISETITYGIDVSLQSVLPDSFSILELVNDLTKMFNLYWRTNTGTKTVYVEPRDDFFQSITTATDYTDKLDLSKGYSLIDFKSVYGRYLNFEYAEDSNDGYVSELNKISVGLGGSKYAALKDYDLGSDFEDEKTTIKHNRIAATYYYQANLTDPWSGQLWTDYQTTRPEYSTDFAPRILSYKYGTQTSPTGENRYFQFYNAGTLEKTTTIPYALDHSINHNGTIEASVDEVLTYNNTNLTLANKKGLVEKYYSGSVNFLKNGKILNINLKLSYSDFNNIDFREPIYFSAPEEIQGYWVFEEIKNFPLMNGFVSIECVLNKIINYETLNVGNSIIIDDGNDKPPLGGKTFTAQDPASLDGITVKNDGLHSSDGSGL